MSPSPNIAALLDQSGWIQSLAHRLVTDPDVADDLVQQTWIDALEHQPDTNQPVRGWLATVLRNNLAKLRRTDANRASRERLVSSDERVDTTAHDVLERAATHRDLVLAVMDLEEPYRSTILLRFFENLPYADIARRQRVTRAAVNSRITRGLEQLRQKLEKSYGDRRSTLRALAPLAFCRPEGAVPIATGVKLMPLAAGIAVTGLAVTAAVQLAPSGTPAPALAVQPSFEVQEAPPWTPDLVDPELVASEGAIELGMPDPPSLRLPVDPTAGLASDEVWETDLFDSRALPAQAQDIAISTGAGEVNVERSTSGSLELDVHVRADLERADPNGMTQYLDDHVTVAMEGGTLEIEDAHKGEDGWSVSITVRIPAALPVTANSGAGEVIITYADNSVVANSGAGEVHVLVPNTTVGSISANTGAGEVHIDVAGVSGKVSGNSGAGSVHARVRDVTTTGRVTLNSGAGDTHLTVPRGIAGTFDLRADLGTFDVPAGLGLHVEEDGMGARARGSIGSSSAVFSLSSGVGSVHVDFGEGYETR